MLIDSKPPLEPPPYSAPAPSSSAPGPQDDFKPAVPPPEARKVNMYTTSVSRDKIQGPMVVDPNMVLPEALLPPLASGETVRPNLQLRSQYGRVDSDIWILDTELNGDAKPKRTQVKFSGTYAGVYLRLHSLGNVPCDVSVDTEYHSAMLTLPHDFVGIITMRRSYGKVKPLPKRVQQISDVGGDMRCFVGDISLIPSEGWAGHTVDVKTSYGMVGVAFADEVVSSTKDEGGSKNGFLSFFGL